jgi:hypothetical protein
VNEELFKFIITYLNEMQAFDVSGYLRPTLHGFSQEYVDSVRNELANIIRTRGLSVADYEQLTDIHFASEEDLYDYLGKMYEYLFADGDQQPAPP